MNSTSDTIAAIATASGPAGIAIVRISGPEALAIADRVLKYSGKCLTERQGGSFLHGYVKSSGNMDLDEVIILIYRAPESYTREDVIEIQGHGGIVSSRRILQTVLNAGARLAEPGEFTRRAFLNGRIDLLQAEAVADLIQAQSDRAANSAIEQLEGRLSNLFSIAYDDIMSVAADMEATLDFSEEELPATVMDNIADRMNTIADRLKNVLDTWEEGHLLRDGALVVISGKPNVGKSTLMNRLLCSDRAIVADVPGTTRDTIEELMILEGIPLRLVDTAGLRKSECVIEQKGVERAYAILKRADIQLYVIDASVELENSEGENIKSLDPDKTILVLNKTDLGRRVEKSDFPNYTTIETSLLEDRDTESIRKAIMEKLGIINTAPPHAVISERHRQYIQNALNELNNAEELVRSNPDSAIVLSANALRTALEYLGNITGRIYSKELLDNIFKKFCIGK